MCWGTTSHICVLDSIMFQATPASFHTTRSRSGWPHPRTLLTVKPRLAKVRAFSQLWISILGLYAEQKTYTYKVSVLRRLSMRTRSTPNTSRNACSSFLAGHLGSSISLVSTSLVIRVRIILTGHMPSSLILYLYGHLNFKAFCNVNVLVLCVSLLPRNPH